MSAGAITLSETRAYIAEFPECVEAFGRRWLIEMIRKLDKAFLKDAAEKQEQKSKK